MNDMSYESDMSIDEKVLMAVVRVAESFKRDASALFRKHGLTFSQYNVLRVLDASKDGENTMRDASKIMLASGANMSGIAKRLEKGGFIIRKGDPNDDRVKRLKITGKGKQTLDDIAEAKEQRIRTYLNNYSDEKKTVLLDMLREMRKRINRRP
ncbi:MAG: MarR family transcriptional regulator [Deltaproteobacteria bacterium]|nr:MarR family transcriptional regulator [Deltaproteobacteria bacterium]